MKSSIISAVKASLNTFILDKVGKRWSDGDQVSTPGLSAQKRWWQFRTIRDELNLHISSDGSFGDVFGAAKNVYGILPCDRAISVGCGNAGKEIDLVRKGLVSSFDLYELSMSRLNQAKATAESLGIAHSFTFNQSNVFDLEIQSDSYDLVYWDNSLHHMFDVNGALEWSYRVLRAGGGLLMNDYVGPSRFQWSKAQLEYAKQVRECFVGTNYLTYQNKRDKPRSTSVKKPTKLGMWLDDPSEAADSDAIIASLMKYFPNANIHYLGGVIYHLALNDILVNFDDNEDKHVLKLLMLIDRLISEQGQNHYAAVFAKK